MLFDTHLHLIYPDILRYPWLDKVDLLNKPSRYEDYHIKASRLGISACLHMEVDVGENQIKEETKMIHNLIENNDVSFTFKLDPVSFYIEEFFINNHRKRQLKPEFDKLREMKTKIVDYPIAIEARDGINHGYGWENHKPYLNNYFSIVTETLYFQGGGYCSEKIWKPFAYFHPIILVGSPGSLKYVREFGFKTFHPFIDETYDECLDGRERFSLIEKEIVKINSMTKEELHKWYWDMEDILVHNYKLFMEYGKNNRDIRGGFLYLLEQEINNQDLVGYTYLPNLK